MEPQQVDLTGARPRVATQRLELARQIALVGTGGAQVLEELVRLVADERVERGPLRGRFEQPLVGVLAVELDQLRRDVGQLPRGREPPVDVGAAASVSWYDAG